MSGLMLLGTGRAGPPPPPEPPPEPTLRRLMPGKLLVADEAGYKSYPGSCVLADDTEVLIYRNGTGHNTANGRPWLRTISPVGVVSAPVEIEDIVVGEWAPGDAYTNIVDSGLVVTATGRLLWSFVLNDPPGGDASSAAHFSFSDDDGATWAPPELFGPSYIGGVPWSFLSSPALALPGGDLLQAFYGTHNDAGGVWHVRLMLSEDDGETWTDLEVEMISPGETLAEPYLELDGVGGVLMAIRAGDVPGGTPAERIVGTRAELSDLTEWAALTTWLTNANARPSIIRTPDDDILLTSRGATDDAPNFGQGCFATMAVGGVVAGNRGQLASSPGRFVYAAPSYVGAPNTDGALRAVVAQQRTAGGADIYRYAWTAPDPPSLPTHEDYDAAIEALNPVEYWPLLEEFGQSVTGINGHVGELVGDLRLQGASGLAVQGVVLDIEDAPTESLSFIRVPHSLALNMADECSIVLWVEPSDVSGTALMVKGPPYNFRLETLVGRLLFGVTADDFVLGEASLAIGVPHMVGISYDGAQVRFFVDGVLDRVQAYAFVPNAAAVSELWIGTASNGTAADPLHGGMGGPALFDYKLEDAEHAGLWAARPGA